MKHGRTARAALASMTSWPAVAWPQEIREPLPLFVGERLTFRATLERVNPGGSTALAQAGIVWGGPTEPAPARVTR